MLKIVDKSSGICHNIHMNHTYNLISNTERYKLLFEMQQFLHSKGWHSGDTMYPIKHPRLNAEKAFLKCYLWTRLTKYGRRRRTTFAHLNKYLEELRNA